jgi:hypothetical protein
MLKVHPQGDTHLCDLLGVVVKSHQWQNSHRRTGMRSGLPRRDNLSFDLVQFGPGEF